MFKRILPAALIAAALALVAVGGVVFATGRSDGEDSKDELVDRVATELGLEPQAVEDALSQAEHEALKEKQDKFLANLVERGIITQEEADSASAWLDSRPAAADKVLQDARALPIIIKAGVMQALPGIAGGLELHGMNGDLLDRAAEILGVSPEELRQAFENASGALRSEHMVQALNDVVDTLVENGVLTQAEGDEVKAWIAGMPDWLKDSDLIGRLLKPGDLHIFPAPGDGPPLPDFELPDGFPAPDGTMPFRFYFNGPEGKFDLQAEPDGLPEGLAPFLDELHKNFDFDFLEPPSSSEGPASPGHGPDAAPSPDSTVTQQGA